MCIHLLLFSLILIHILVSDKFLDLFLSKLCGFVLLREEGFLFSRFQLPFYERPFFEKKKKFRGCETCLMCDRRGNFLFVSTIVCDGCSAMMK